MQCVNGNRKKKDSSIRVLKRMQRCAKRAVIKKENRGDDRREK